MNINFRQGIISSQQLPRFLQKNVNGNVDFDASVTQTILNFADGASNYLFYESKSIKNAWSVPLNQSCWLYWDISTEDATRSFGYTLYNPLSTTAPENPKVNQMYFDLNKFKYQSWTGQYWRDVIRVIAGSIDSNGKILCQSKGTQINYYKSVNTDVIVFDFTKKPIKNYTDNGFEFLNKYTIINFKNNGKDSFNYNRIVNSNGIASEPLSKHYCVTWKDYGSLQLADPTIETAAFALAERAVDTGEIVSLFFDGFVMNRTDWNWPNPAHTSLYVGNNGALTTEFDSTFSYSMQKIGYIVSPNTIYVNFNKQYLKYIAVPPTPVPSPSPTVTPSNTVTPSSTPIATSTPTPTPTPTTLPPPGHCGAYFASQDVLLGSAGMTQVVNGNYDDNAFSIGDLPFDFYFNGVNYGNGNNGGIYFCANSFITFGFSDTSYSGFSATVPGIAILIQANDNSVQQFFTQYDSASSTYRIRYEGTSSTGGTIGSPNMVWELTFYQNQKIKLVVGTMNRTVDNGSVCGISNGSTFSSTTEYSANTSYGLVDDDGDHGTGLTWTASEGTIISNECLPDPTPTPSVTMTATPAATITPTVTSTPPVTASPVATATPTMTTTVTPTLTATSTPPVTVTITPTLTATSTPPVTVTPTSTPATGVWATWSTVALPTETTLSSGNMVATSTRPSNDVDYGTVSSSVPLPDLCYYEIIYTGDDSITEGAGAGAGYAGDGYNTGYAGDDTDSCVIYGTDKAIYWNNVVQGTADGDLTGNTLTINVVRNLNNIWLRLSPETAWVGGGDPSLGTLPSFTLVPYYGQTDIYAVTSFIGDSSATLVSDPSLMTGVVPNGIPAGIPIVPFVTPTPTVTPTITLTPSVTPTIGASPTPTPTPPTLFTVWSPTNKATNIVLTNGNLTATRPTSATGYYCSGRSVNPISANAYWEIKVTTKRNTNAAGDNYGFGIIGSTFDIEAAGGNYGSTLYIGGDSPSIGLWDNDSVVFANNVYDTGATSTTPIIYKFAYNPTTFAIWMGTVQHGWIGGGDPAAGTDPTYQLDGTFGTAYAAYTITANNQACIANFGNNAFSGVVPTGFAGISS